MQHMIDTLLNLEDECEKLKWKFTKHKSLFKRWFDRQLVGRKYFQVYYLVLKWDKVNEVNGKHTKFQNL